MEQNGSNKEAADNCVRGRIDVSPHHTYVKVDQKQKNPSSP